VIDFVKFVNMYNYLTISDVYDDAVPMVDGPWRPAWGARAATPIAGNVCFFQL